MRLDFLLRVGVRWGSPPSRTAELAHLTLPAQPRRAPPSPPGRAERGFSAGNSLLRCSAFRTRPRGVSRFLAPTACHLRVKIEAYHSCQDGGGWQSRRVIRCAAARPPALPAPSLRASISLPAKTAGPLRFLLVKHLIRNGLWQCARRFFGCVLDFSPCSQGGSSLSSDRSHSA